MANIAKRPGVVLAAAILLFIFGGLSVLGSCCAGAGLLMQGVIPEPPAVQGKKPPNAMDLNRKVAEEVPGFIIVESGTHGLNLLLGLVKIFAGIGLLKMSSPARLLAIGAAIVSILVTLGHAAYTAVLVIPVYDKVFAEQLKNAPPMPFDFAQLMQGSMWVGVLFGIVLALAIWLTVIFLLSGQKVRAAFAEAGLPPVEEEPPRSRLEGYDDDDRPPETGITDRLS